MPDSRAFPPGNYKATVGGSHVSIGYDTADMGSCEAVKHSPRYAKVSYTVSANVTVLTAAASPAAPAGAPTAQLKRGMSIEEVTRLLGQGKLLTESVTGADLKTQVFEYVSTDRRVDVTYVDGLVVRYTINSK